jgi:Fe2+ or Zn2+ uptake regulation protein
MFKKKKFDRGSGKKRSAITSIIIKVFERNPEQELTHKEITTLVDARDPAARQLVFDTLNLLVDQKTLKRINHLTFKLVVDSTSFFEGTIQITQRGSGFVVCQGREKDIFIAPQN